MLSKNGNIGNKILDRQVQGSWCHGVELTPSLLQKVNSVLYMCSYCYKELKASGFLETKMSMPCM